jgi:hypothetical protein
MNAGKILTTAQLALAGAIVGMAAANLGAHLPGIGGSQQAVGAGGFLTAALVKLGHLV